MQQVAYIFVPYKVSWLSIDPLKIICKGCVSYSVIWTIAFFWDHNNPFIVMSNIHEVLSLYGSCTFVSTPSKPILLRTKFLKLLIRHSFQVLLSMSRTSYNYQVMLILESMQLTSTHSTTNYSNYYKFENRK